MALITCPECFNDVSEHAKSCPRCGYVFDDKIGYTSNQYMGKNQKILGVISIISSFLVYYAGFESLGVLLFIAGIILGIVGKFNHWYHN